MYHTLSTQFKQAHYGGRRGRGHQAGVTVLGALLALAIGATVTYGQIQGQLTGLQITDGQLEGDLFNRIKDAQNTYALENYPSLQSNLSVAKNSITLAVGNAPGQSLAPRVEDLVAMGYLVNGTTSASNKIPGGVYRVVFTKSPVGCQPAACDIVGDAYIDKPYFRTGTTEANGPSIGAFIQRVGGDATVSLVSAPGVLISANQVQTTNPVAGGPAGVIGARVGFGSSGFGRFLVVGDSRDPKFRGGATLGGAIATNPGFTLDVQGNTSLKGNVSLVDPATGASCIDMLNTVGQISINCQGLLRAKLATFSTGGLGTIRIGETGTGDIVTTDGSIKATLGFTGNGGTLFGPGLGNGIKTTGLGFGVQGPGGSNVLSVTEGGAIGAGSSVNARVLGLNGVVAPQSACSPTQGTNASSASDTALAPLAGGGVASCIAGLWTPISSVAAPGTACSTDGVAATSNAPPGSGNKPGSTLVCKNGVYVQLNDLLSTFVLMETYRVIDNQSVPKPNCGQNGASFGVPKPVIIGQQEASTQGTALASFDRSVIDLDATHWQVVLKDSNGNSLTGADALFQSFCYY